MLLYFRSSSKVNVRRCEFFGHVQNFWSYSYGHLESVMLTFIFKIKIKIYFFIFLFFPFLFLFKAEGKQDLFQHGLDIFYKYFCLGYFKALKGFTPHNLEKIVFGQYQF